MTTLQRPPGNVSKQSAPLSSRNRFLQRPPRTSHEHPQLGLCPARALLAPSSLADSMPEPRGRGRGLVWANGSAGDRFPRPHRAEAPGLQSPVPYPQQHFFSTKRRDDENRQVSRRVPCAKCRTEAPWLPFQGSRLPGSRSPPGTLPGHQSHPLCMSTRAGTAPKGCNVKKMRDISTCPGGIQPLRSHLPHTLGIRISETRASLEPGRQSSSPYFLILHSKGTTSNFHRK